MRSDQILERTMKRVDETTLLELGREVERRLWQENSGNPMLSDAEQLMMLFITSEAAAHTLAGWKETEDRLATLGDGRPGAARDHALDCPCDPCERGWKRLMYAVGVLPKKHQAVKR